MSMTNTPFYAASIRTVQTQLHAQMKSAVVFKAGANGSRVHLISLAQDDTSTGNVQLFRGTARTSNASAGLAITNGSPSTITRSSGSFLTDGWQRNMRLFSAYADGPSFTDSQNLLNQVAAHLSNTTAPTATTLTFNATVFNAADASPPTTMSLIQAILMFTVALVSGAGNATGTNGINLLDTIRYPGLFQPPDNALVLGPNESLIATLATTPTAVTAVDINVSAEDY